MGQLQILDRFLIPSKGTYSLKHPRAGWGADEDGTGPGALAGLHVSAGVGGWEVGNSPSLYAPAFPVPLWASWP